MVFVVPSSKTSKLRWKECQLRQFDSDADDDDDDDDDDGVKSGRMCCQQGSQEMLTQIPVHICGLIKDEKL